MTKARIRLAKSALAWTASGISILSGVPAMAAAADQATAATGKKATEEVVSAEIVVTANRREELLRNVPISVAAFSNQTLDRQSVRSVDDLARVTPGLTFTRQTFGSGDLSNIAIRGIYATSGAATTGIYVDDTAIQVRTNPQTAAGSAFPDIFDLDRVEVLRGPQGTLFGAGAEGGVVRFITPTPSLTSSSIYARGEASTTKGGDPSYEAGVAVGMPLVEDKIGLRLSGNFRHTGGWVDRRPFNDATPNDKVFKNTNSADGYSLRGSLLFQPVESVRINPAVFFQQRKGKDSSTLWESLSDPDAGRYENGYQFPQTSNDRFIIPSLKIGIDLPGSELTSVTSYFDRRVRNVWDYTQLNTAFIFGAPVPFVPGWADPGYVKLRQKTFSQEVRLSSSDAGARLKWTIGAFYSRGIQDDALNLETNTIGDLIPVEDIFGIPLTNGKSLLTSLNHTVDKQYAAFGQFDYRIVGGLSATVGLRYSKTSLDFERTLGGPINYPGTGPESQTQQGTQKSHPFTPKFAVNYQADDNNLFYISAAKGFRIGGVNSAVFANCVISDVPVTYGPDTTWSYEAGSKNSLFGGKVRIEQSLFYIKWKNIQQSVDAGCGGNAFTDNLGNAISKGFDLAFSAKVTTGVTLSGSVGYVRSRLQNTIIDGANRIVVRKGDALIGSPWQLALNADFRQPIGSDLEAYLGTYLRYNSHNNGRLASRELPNAVGYDPTVGFDPAVTEVNLRAGLRRDGIDASLSVNNLLDAHPRLARAHDTPDSSLYYFSTLRPRTIGLTVTIRR